MESQAVQVPFGEPLREMIKVLLLLFDFFSKHMTVMCMFCFGFVLFSVVSLFLFLLLLCFCGSCFERYPVMMIKSMCI